MLSGTQTPIQNTTWRNLLIACVHTLAWLFLAGCSVTRIETTESTLGTKVTQAAMLQSLSQPGRVTFTKHRAGTWQVPLSGLLNLKHPKAVAAGLGDRDEAIEIYTYSLQHPTQGTFIVDSGLAETMREPSTNNLAAIVKMAMNVDALVTEKTTLELSSELDGIDGVFLTHLHLDHIMGLLDLSNTVPVYVGPGDADLTTFMNMFTQGTIDRLLGNIRQLQEWSFSGGQIIDIFNDGSVFAIHAPGHTPGTTAYLANTTDGWQLMIGDVTHTRWGWEHGVEPGTYSHDLKASAASLAFIQRLALKLPGVRVHPGHQSLAN